MTESGTATGRTLPASLAVLVLALTAAACSGEAGASADGPGAERGTDGASTPTLATATFDVEGMTCGGCALATELSVEKLEGVASADADYDEATGEGRCTVTYDPSAVGTDRIAAAIEEAGFTPTLNAASGARSPAPLSEDGP